MKRINKIGRRLTAILVFTLVLLLLMPGIADARGGRGSFGGRRSAGRTYSRSSRTMSAPRSTSFGSRRSSRSIFHNKRSSFGSTRLNSSKEYTSRYGIPRRTIKGGAVKGVPKNYRINDYGGYGSGLMMGYMMGHTPFIWHTPFHRAFYYTQPYYVKNSDGTTSVYPPTFSFSKVIFTIFVFAGIIFVLYKIIKSFKHKKNNYSAGSGQYGSKSSFS